MGILTDELRRCFRSLLHDPGFTIVTVVTMAVGVGGLGVTFSLFKSLLIDRIPYEGTEPSALLWSGTQSDAVSLPYYRSLAERSSFLNHTAVFIEQTSEWSIAGVLQPVRSASVSADLFKVFSTSPLRGRTFTSEDDQPGRPKVALISEAFSASRYGKQDDPIGRVIIINQSAYVVIGVLASSFKFPATDTEIWTPINVDFAEYYGLPNAPLFRMICTIRPGISLSDAISELIATVVNLDRQYRSSRRGPIPTLLPYREYVVGRVRTAVTILLLAGCFVLVIACINVVNLFLIRSDRRIRDSVVRVSLGESKARCLFRALAESAIISLVGTIIGVLFAHWAVHYVRLVAREQIPRMHELTFDTGAMLVVIAVMILITVMTAVAAGLKSRRTTTIMWAAIATTRGFVRGRRVRALLVISQYAVALVLMIAAGLMLRSFYRLVHIGLGFNPTNVFTFRLRIAKNRFGDNQQLAAFYDRVEQTVAALPGVISVGCTSQMPLTGSGGETPIKPEGRLSDPHIWTSRSIVSAGFFRVMSIPLLSGRPIDKSDRDNAALVAVVDEALAKRISPNQSAVGSAYLSHFILKPPNPNPIAWDTISVIGVSMSVQRYALNTILPSRIKPAGQLYEPMTAGNAPVSMYFVVKTDGDPAAWSKSIKSAVTLLDSAVVMTEVRSLESLWLDFSAETRLYTALLNAFAAIALFVGSIGIYGVIGYSVAERAHEFGIRLSLGATRFIVFCHVFKEGASWVIIASLIGLGISISLTKYMSAILFDVGEKDPAIFVIVILVLIIVSATACYIPARKAATMDPWLSLRRD